MRYLVRAFTTHEQESSEANSAIAAGDIVNAEQLEGFVQGYADEDGVRNLAARGLAITVEAAEATLPEAGISDYAARTFSVRTGTGFDTVEAMPSVRRPDGRSEYFLLRIPGGLSAARKNQLAGASINILERDQGDWYVAKLPNPDAVFGLDFVTGTRLYDAEETIGSPSLALDVDTASGTLTTAGSSLSAALLYDATLHPGANIDTFIEELTTLGARALVRSDRTVRVALGTSRAIDVADLPEVQQFAPVQAPKLMDDIARTIIRLEDPNATPARLIDLDGTGELVGVADTGLDEQHPDFAGRIEAVIARGRTDDGSDPDGHGTHVAGIVTGSGVSSNGVVAGVAPAARLYFQSVMDANGRLGGLPADVKVLFQEAYDAGVRVHNNSWGAYLYARYGANSIQTDTFVYNNPDFLPVIAAGNEGSCLPGAGGRPAGFVDFPSLSAPATAKNALTVGASRNGRTKGGYSQLTWGEAWATEFPAAPIRDEKISGDSEALAGFSSRGPCDYGAIKPDLTAPGTDIASTRSSIAPLRNFWGAFPGNPRYAFMGGTSQATPIVTGAATLVRQYYRRDRNHAPSAALVKATLINGTATMLDAGANGAPSGFPNFDQGFGRLDLVGSLPNTTRPDMRLEFVDCPATTTRLFTAMGQRHRWRIELDQEGDLRLCLAWTDPPARALQNSISMLLDQGALGGKWSSNADAAVLLNLMSPTVFSGLPQLVNRDASNNVHILRVPGAKAGSYTLSLVADFMTTDSQAWALVATGPIAQLVEEA